ncbi:hypothetical protein ACFVS2_20480 [Brevibacillus sp. NPDC058079]|uniref:hypothetical protein n=1 Tax=Brevibacillus sp. NPDC058079 TaxID=3346330 RepID=UPI0036E7EB2F
MAVATANAVLISGNQQALLFIQSFFKQGVLNQTETITVNVKDKYEAIPFKIEVNPNTDGTFVAYRVHTSAGESLWQTWETAEDVEKSFQMMSLM